MVTRAAIQGSKYLESKLYKTWPIFSWARCVICGKEYRREWLWKFLKRRNYALQRPQRRHACFDCVTDGYNEAVSQIDNYYLRQSFGTPPRIGTTSF